MYESYKKSRKRKGLLSSHLLSLSKKAANDKKMHFTMLRTLWRGHKKTQSEGGNNGKPHWVLSSFNNETPAIPRSNECHINLPILNQTGGQSKRALMPKIKNFKPVITTNYKNFHYSRLTIRRSWLLRKNVKKTISSATSTLTSAWDMSKVARPVLLGKKVWIKCFSNFS